MFKFTLGVRLGIQGDRTFQSGAAGYGEAGQPALWILLGWTVRSFAYLMHCVQLAAAKPRQEPEPAPPQTVNHAASSRCLHAQMTASSSPESSLASEPTIPPPIG